MPRGDFDPIDHLEADARYNSVLVSRLINKVMQGGEKNTARKIVYGAMEEAADKIDADDPLNVLDEAIQNISPAVELRTRRLGGATYQIPVEISGTRKIVIAARWLVEAARSYSGKPIKERLAHEIIDAYNNEGKAIQKKEETHKMAKANRAFAHLGSF